MFPLLRKWWVPVLRGIFAVIFGIVTFTWPGLTLLALVIIYSVYAIVDGVTAIILALTHYVDFGSLLLMLLLGLVSVAAGVVAWRWPGITALVFLILIASWAIVRGIFDIIAAIRLRNVIQNEWMLLLDAVLSIAFGALLLAWPGIGLLSLVWVIGAYAVVFGVVSMSLGFRMRHELHALQPAV